MWGSVLAIISSLVSYFFKPKTAEAQARDDGQSAGVSMQKAADESAVLKDIQDAKQASNSVDSATAGGVPISASDGFRRD